MQVMPRVARLDIPGVMQHVIVRGIEKKAIFLDEGNRRRFLDRLSDVLMDTETLCYAWSLMPNTMFISCSIQCDSSWQSQ